MIVVPHPAPPARRWLAHLLRAAEGSSRAGDPFDDELPFEAGAVERLAREQGVAAVVHRGIALGRIADPLPDSFRAACLAVYADTRRRTRVALHAGWTIRRALDRAGIAAASLPGWALLEGGSPPHPDPGTRPLDGLDLLVRGRDCGRAAGALGELGFRPLPRPSREGAPLFQRPEADLELVLALHSAWDPSPGSRRGGADSADRFLERLCDRAEAGDTRASRLGCLLFTASQAARRAPARWIWLVDLHRLVSLAPLDWDGVVAAASEWRMRRALYAGLLATRELLRTPIPKEVLARLAPGPLRRRLLHRSLAASALQRRGGGAGWAARLLLRDSWWQVGHSGASAPAAAGTAQAGSLHALENGLTGRRAGEVAGGER